MKKTKLLSLIILVASCINMLPVFANESIDVLLETNSEQNILTAVCQTEYDSVEWEISDSIDGYFDAILNAGTDTYIPSVEDAGKYIRAKVVVNGNDYYSGIAEIKPQYTVEDEFDSNADADLSKWNLAKIGNDCTAGVETDLDENGYFYMNQTGSSIVSEATRSFEAINEKVVVESRFKNDNGKAAVFYIKSGGNPAINMNVGGADINVTYGNGSGSTESMYLALPYSTETWYTIRLVINPTGNTNEQAVDIYFGTDEGMVLKKQGACMRTAVSGVDNIWFAKTQVGRFMIDYLKVYSKVKVILPEIPDEKSVELDAKLITSDILTSQNVYAITEDLTLPTIGTYGSDISWESKNPAIDDFGVVSRDKGNAYGSLTAYIRKGDFETSKEFSFLVLKNPEKETSALLDLTFDNNEHGFETTPSENAVAEDGVLKIHNSVSPSDTIGDVVRRFSEVSNGVFIEGDVKVTANSATIFYLRKGSTTALNFNYSGGTLTCRHGDMTIDSSIVNTQTVASGAAGKWFHLKIFMDFASQKADVYVNTEMKLSGVSFRNSVQGIDNFLFGKPLAGEGNIYLDNVKIYEKQADLSDIMNKVTLPSEADMGFELPESIDGSKITWLSLNTDYIVVDGTEASLTRPAVDEEDVSVQLIGIFESETAVDSKVYDILVKREPTDSEAVAKAKETFEWETISDEEIGAVTKNFHFPNNMKDNVKITYVFNKPEFVNGEQVSRPLEHNVEVKLIVKFERNGVTDEEEFVFTILNIKDDSTVDVKSLLEADINAIDLGDLSSVTQNLTLPATGQNGTSFTWKSGNESVVSSTGVISRGTNNTSAYLTLTAKLLNESAEKSFYVTVKGTGNSGSGGGGGSSSRPSSSGGSGFGGFSVGTSNNVTNKPAALPQTNESIFVDIEDVEWAKEAIVSLVKKGVVSVNDSKTFEPDRNITREEAIKMIVVAFGVEADSSVSSFVDVNKDAWYYTYVAKAENAGIINGISKNKFGVSLDITRQDSVVMLYNTLKKYYEIQESENNKMFEDAENISDYAVVPINYFAGLDIINGYENNTFLPKNNITRAEFATILVRLLNQLIRR